MQRNLAKKIRAKRESGLTTVRLKRDPPVCGLNGYLFLHGRGKVDMFKIYMLRCSVKHHVKMYTDWGTAHTSKVREMLELSQEKFSQEHNMY